MFIDMDIEVAKVGEMMAAPTAKHHDGAFGETAAIISD